MKAQLSLLLKSELFQKLGRLALAAQALLSAVYYSRQVGGISPTTSPSIAAVLLFQLTLHYWALVELGLWTRRSAWLWLVLTSVELSTAVVSGSERWVIFIAFEKLFWVVLVWPRTRQCPAPTTG